MYIGYSPFIEQLSRINNGCVPLFFSPVVKSPSLRKAFRKEDDPLSTRQSPDSQQRIDVCPFHSPSEYIVSAASKVGAKLCLPLDHKPELIANQSNKVQLISKPISNFSRSPWFGLLNSFSSVFNKTMFFYIVIFTLFY